MERHVLREGTTSCPIASSGSQEVPTLAPLASRIVRDNLAPLIGCMSLAQLPILSTLSKSDRLVLITCGLLPVTHLLDLTAPTHCHRPVYQSQRDNLSKHSGSLETNRKSMSYVI